MKPLRRLWTSARQARPARAGRGKTMPTGWLDMSYLYAFLGETTMAVMFVFYVVLARVLGPETYGVFAAAAALSGILGVFIQFGLPVLLTRDVAGDRRHGSASTGRFLLIQGINTLPVLAVLPLLARMLGFDRQGLIICLLMCLAELCRSAKMLWRAVMKGNGWFHTESVSVAIERITAVGCSLAVLLLTGNLVWVVATLVLVRICDNAGVGLFLASRVPLSGKCNGAGMAASYRRALPFAVHGILWILYYQVDMVMLKAMAPEAEAGYYGASFRVMEIFSALPRVVFYVAFTRFARCMAENPALLPRKVLEATRVLVVVVLPPLVLAGYTQPWLLRLMYGPAYLPSIILLAVLLPGLGVKMFSTLAEEYLLATGSEKKLPPLLLVVALTNIGANLCLIPRLGAMGAALATILSESVFCLLGMTIMLRGGAGGIGPRIINVLVPTVILGAAPTLLVVGLPLAWSLGIGLLAAVWLTRNLRRGRFLGRTQGSR